LDPSPQSTENTSRHWKREQVLWVALIVIGLLILAFWRVESNPPPAPPPPPGTATPSPTISPTPSETSEPTLEELPYESTQADAGMNLEDLATLPADTATETPTWYVRPFSTRTPTPPHYSGGTFNTSTPYFYWTQYYQTSAAQAKTATVAAKKTATVIAPTIVFQTENARQTATFVAFATSIYRTPRPQQIAYSSGSNMIAVSVNSIYTATPTPTSTTTAVPPVVSTPIPLGSGTMGDWAPGGLRFVFASTDGKISLQSVNVDGTLNGSPLIVPNTPDGANIQPAWSSNGSWIVFRHSGGSKPAGLYRISPDGFYLQQLTDNADDQTPSWSPDSGKIVFVSGNDLYFIAVSPVLPYAYPTPLAHTATPTPSVTPSPIRDRTRLTRTDGIESGPRYSPDGRYMLYAREDAGHSDIYLLDLSQAFIGPPLNLTADVPGSQVNPAWSRDNTRLIFVSKRPDGTNIFMLDRFGNVIQMTTDPDTTDKDTLRWRP
jgi:Tol biopolymer transport system component